MCRGRDTGCPAPPHRSRRAVFPHRALRVDTLSSRTGRFARWVRHSYGTGCLCVLRQHVGPFSSFGACALPLDTMSRSDSRSARRHFLSLRLPSCLALAVSAAGTLRASSVSCDSRTPDIGTKSRCVVFRSFDPENAIRVRGFCQCDALHTQRLVTHSRRKTSQYFEETIGMSGGLDSFSARHALRPRQAFKALTYCGPRRIGFRHTDTVPACVCCFRGCLA